MAGSDLFESEDSASRELEHRDLGRSSDPDRWTPRARTPGGVQRGVVDRVQAFDTRLLERHQVPDRSYLTPVRMPGDLHVDSEVRCLHRLLRLMCHQ